MLEFAEFHAGLCRTLLAHMLEFAETGQTSENLASTVSDVECQVVGGLTLRTIGARAISGEIATEWLL
jgi:hypothetical protein